MADVMKMAIVYGLEHLYKYLPGLVLCKLSFLVQMLIQLPTFKETTLTIKLLSNQVKKTVILVSFIKLHNVGMIQFLENINLSDKLIQVSYIRLGDLLDCSISVFLGEHFSLVNCAI